MAGSRRLKKQYTVPRKRWDKNRFERERVLLTEYGLKNKRELRRIETILRKKRENARKLLALGAEKREERQRVLMLSLDRMGLLKQGATLDDVLGLTVKELLERRMQTMVWRKNLANTIEQARQFIAHGHIAINGKKVNCPGYIVLRDEEGKISYFGKPMKIKLEKKEDAKLIKKLHAGKHGLNAHAGSAAEAEAIAAEGGRGSGTAEEGKADAKAGGKESAKAADGAASADDEAGTGEATKVTSAEDETVPSDIPGAKPEKEEIIGFPGTADETDEGKAGM
ncbi:MAG: 30S ribosomal protein S4 [Candidatus Diapherotrites archaeon]